MKRKIETNQGVSNSSGIKFIRLNYENDTSIIIRTGVIESIRTVKYCKEKEEDGKLYWDIEIRVIDEKDLYSYRFMGFEEEIDIVEWVKDHTVYL
jgi:hypothetical protein